jgi:hypothetical protein
MLVRNMAALRAPVIWNFPDAFGGGAAAKADDAGEVMVAI